MQPPGWLIHSGRVCVGTASLGTTIDSKFDTVLLLAGIGVSMILQHLAGVPLGSEEVDGLLSSMASDFLGIGTGVTPTMGTWGCATMIDDVEASVRDALEEMKVYACGEEVASESASNILAAGVPSSTTSNC